MLALCAVGVAALALGADGDGPAATTVEVGARAGTRILGGGDPDELFAPATAVAPRAANSALARARRRAMGRRVVFPTDGVAVYGTPPELVGATRGAALAGVWSTVTAEPSDAVQLGLSLDTGGIFFDEHGATPAAGTWFETTRLLLREAYAELGDPVESDTTGWLGKRRTVLARGYVYDARGFGGAVDWEREAGPALLAASAFVQRPREEVDQHVWRSPLLAVEARVERAPPDDRSSAHSVEPRAGLFGAYLHDGDDLLAGLVAGTLPSSLDGARLRSRGSVLWGGGRAELDAGPLSLSALGARGAARTDLTIRDRAQCTPDGLSLRGWLGVGDARWYWARGTWTGAFALVSQGHSGAAFHQIGSGGLAKLCAGQDGVRLRGFPAIAPWLDEATLVLGGGLDASWRARGVRVAGVELRGVRAAGVRTGAALGNSVTLRLSAAWLRADGALPPPPPGQQAAGLDYGLEVDTRARWHFASTAALALDGAWLHPGNFFAADSGEVWQVLAQLEAWVDVR